MSPEYLEYLYQLGISNIKLGLNTIKEILKRLGNPHHHPKIIHLAGTNGKGSTLVTLEKLILSSGYSTGSTVSPHLVSFNERFRHNSHAVSDSDLDEVFLVVSEVCGYDFLKKKDLIKNPLKPTFFEFSIAMAFVLFQKWEVDFILLETGLGGRLDATNVVSYPLLCILTKLDIDHQEYLGDTIEQIVVEKMGILKPKCPVFISPQTDKITCQILRFTEENAIPSFFSRKNYYHTEKEGMACSFYFKSLKSHYSQDHYFSHQLTIGKFGLLGDFQKDNTVTALAAYFYAVPPENHLNEKEINHVLRDLKWPGRMEYLNEDRKILLDGAHNESGMLSLMNYLNDCHSSETILFAIGWMKKKELVSAFSSVSLKSITFLPLQIEYDRSEDVENIYSMMKERDLNVCLPVKIRELVNQIRLKLLPKHDLLVISGSLYLLGEFLSEWKKETELLE